MSIIDSIRLSGTTYQIQGEVTVDAALDSGSTNPVANSAITTALDDKVNVADNNASAYTFENKIGRAEYGYSEHFAGPIYIRYKGSTSSIGNYYAGRIAYYTSEWGWEDTGLYFNLSNGQITATTVSSNYFDIEIENGEAALTFKDGYYLRQYNSQNEFIALTKTTYESGQSADVIEDTVYDVFDKLNDKIDKTGANVVTGSSMTFSDGYLNSYLNTNKTSISSSVKIDSSTIKSSNNGLSVQFETSEAADKILNVGSGSYGTLFSTDSYDTSFNEFTITFNPNCTQYDVYNFSVRIMDASNAMYDTFFEYDSADMSAVYTNLRTYCTVTDTLSTDYKLKVTAKEGYKIARLHNGNYMVGGVDNTNPNNYISNLVTTPSYVHDGQDVIDDIYDKLDDKQSTLVSGTNIKTINNESILGSGNIDIQGGSTYTAGRGISLSNNTISVSLPISAGTGTNSIVEGHTNNKASGSYSHAEGKGTTASGSWGSHAEGASTTASGDYSHAEGNNTKASGFYSHAEGLYAVANNQSEHASGQYNVSNKASTAFGDSGNTLFSVGNGSNQSNRHNAFEIRQNGDIYISSGGTDIKLQDHLGGGGGKAVSGGTNISITTGETADTINCTLPMSTDSVKKIVVNSNYSSFVTSNAVFTASSLSNSILLGNNTFNIKGIIKGDINNNLIIGSYNTSNLRNGTKPTLEGNLVVGSNNVINSSYSLLVGNNSTISRSCQFAVGYKQHPNNDYETSLGNYNVSSSGSSTFGDSGNTLFSVGNGTSESSRHNAFEIRQNGDIYLTLDGQDVKLQDQLGGSSITVDSALDSGSTNPVENKAIYNKFDEVEQVTAAALNELNDKFDGLRLNKLTQAQYDALTTKDPSTLYVIVD